MSEALLNNAQQLSKAFGRSTEFEQARRLPTDVSDAMSKQASIRCLCRSPWAVGNIAPGEQPSLKPLHRATRPAVG